MKNSAGQFVSNDWTGKEERGFIATEKIGRGKNGYMQWKVKCKFCGQEKVVPSYYIVRKVLRCECEEWVGEYGCAVGRQPVPDHGAHINILYRHYERSAMDRGLCFELTKSEARKFFDGDCYYCGAKPEVRYTSKNLAGEYAWNGIDRVDNSKGYVVENCVSCCKQCNFSKRDLTQGEFVDWVKRVYKHMVEKEGDQN